MVVGAEPLVYFRPCARLQQLLQQLVVSSASPSRPVAAGKTYRSNIDIYKYTHFEREQRIHVVLLFDLSDGSTVVKLGDTTYETLLSNTLWLGGEWSK